MLAGIAVLIGGGLVLLLLGIDYGLPPAAEGTRQPGARIVVTGTGRAEVAVRQDGSPGPRQTVALPWTAPVDRSTSVATIEAQPIGAARVGCTVFDASGQAVRQTEPVADTVVRCDATFR